MLIATLPLHEYHWIVLRIVELNVDTGPLLKCQRALKWPWALSPQQHGDVDVDGDGQTDFIAWMGMPYTTGLYAVGYGATDGEARPSASMAR